MVFGKILVLNKFTLCWLKEFALLFKIKSPSDQILYCPTDAFNYINCRVIKNTLKM